MKNDDILIGAFVKGDKLPRQKARNIFELFGCKQIFCFETTEDNENVFLLTFNISNEEKNQKFQQLKQLIRNCVQLHRNKDTNTLYTINCLNKLIELQSGNNNKDFKVDWNNFKNMCVLLNAQKDIKTLPTKLRMVFKTEKE